MSLKPKKCEPGKSFNFIAPRPHTHLLNIVDQAPPRHRRRPFCQRRRFLPLSGSVVTSHVPRPPPFFAGGARAGGAPASPAASTAGAPAATNATVLDCRVLARLS